MSDTPKIDVEGSPLAPLRPLRCAMDAYSVVVAEREQAGRVFTRGDHERAVKAALEAAAPLVVAAELDALAKKINERADAVHNPADPTSGLFSGGVMTAASIVSARASVLRGEGQTDAE